MCLSLQHNLMPELHCQQDASIVMVSIHLSEHFYRFIWVVVPYCTRALSVFFKCQMSSSNVLI